MPVRVLRLHDVVRKLVFSWRGALAKAILHNLKTYGIVITRDKVPFLQEKKKHLKEGLIFLLFHRNESQLVSELVPLPVRKTETLSVFHKWQLFFFTV